MTLILDCDLDVIKMNLRAKMKFVGQGHETVQTDRQTDVIESTGRK